MTDTRRMIVAILCIILLSAAHPPQADTATQVHVLRYADGQELHTLNPFLDQGENLVALSELTMAHFTRLDDRGNHIADLITTIPSTTNHGVLDDGKTIVWHLRPHLRWSDGQPLTASDVVFTVRVAQDPRNNIADRATWNQIASMTAVNETTVIFHLQSPDPAYLDDFFSARSASCILPQHLLGPSTKINERSYNALPIGAGPFRYTAFHRGENVELEPNPFSWRGKPRLTRIEYRISSNVNAILVQLQSDEIDLWRIASAGVLAQVAAIPSITIQSYPTAGVTILALQTERLSDPRLREALKLGTDRAALLHLIAHDRDTLTESLIPMIAPDYTALPLHRYDPVTANRLLDNAGWERGSDGAREKNGKPLTLSVVEPADSPASASLIELLRAQWRALGITIDVRPIPLGEMYGTFDAGGILATGKFDVALVGYGLDPLNPSILGILDCASRPPAGDNTTRYCDAHLDALARDYANPTDVEHRRATLEKIERLLDAANPFVPLWEQREADAYVISLVGFRPSAYNAWGDPMLLDH